MGSKSNNKRIALLGILTSLIYVGRVSFSFLPNVQPMTTILVIITLTMGIKDSLIIAMLSLIITNLNMGFGVWTVAQMVSFTIILVIVSLFKSVYHRLPVIVMAITCGVLGLLYGFCISLVQAPFFGWVSFIPYYISGFSYDCLHALGNFIFYMILSPILIPLIDKRTN